MVANPISVTDAMLYLEACGFDRDSRLSIWRLVQSMDSAFLEWSRSSQAKKRKLEEQRRKNANPRTSNRR